MYPATVKLILSILKESPLYPSLSAQDRDALLPRMESYGMVHEPGPGTGRTDLLFMNNSQEDH